MFAQFLFSLGVVWFARCWESGVCDRILLSKQHKTTNKIFTSNDCVLLLFSFAKYMVWHFSKIASFCSIALSFFVLFWFCHLVFQICSDTSANKFLTPDRSEFAEVRLESAKKRRNPGPSDESSRRMVDRRSGQLQDSGDSGQPPHGFCWEAQVYFLFWDACVLLFFT